VAEFTADQLRAIAAPGNVLVVAGAGTGKTRTLVERCVARVLDRTDPVSLDGILMVTFTEAAAAEMKRRLRERLDRETHRHPDRADLAGQLALVDTARIGTLHSFCLQLVREHFHELGLDPQLTVLDDSRATVLARECLEAGLRRHWAGPAPADEAVRQLILVYGNGGDEPIRRLVRRLHDYAQTLPEPETWFETREAECAAAQPARWEPWLLAGFETMRDEWLPGLRSGDHDNLRRCVRALESAGTSPRRAAVATACADIAAVDVDANWPRGTKGKFREPNAGFFEEAAFLGSLAELADDGADPLVEDWNWVRPHLQALLGLVREFGGEFARAKRDLGAVDFHDLEQFALRVLWDTAQNQPTATARHWRARLRCVFVDEYQDINAAQDRIIRALSRDGAAANRFLVGDVKQSIYRFRLADPRIFQGCAGQWKTPSSAGQTIPLRDNFRSHPAILEFVNALFAGVMRHELGGVDYDADARLVAGDTGRHRASATRPAADAFAAPVELRLRLSRSREAGGVEGGANETGSPAWEDLTNTEKEATLVGERLRELHDRGFPVWDETAQSLRPVTWSDMVVLLRSPGGKVDTFAKVFAGLGLPLVAQRRGLFDTPEVADLLNLLQLLDNPLQDLPLLGVLRSPLAGFTLEELAAVRLAERRAPCWTALQRLAQSAPPAATGSEDAVAAATESARRKAVAWLARYHRWRERARRAALSDCLEAVLDETHYEDWLLARERGPERRANVRRFLTLTRQFDTLQHQGLFHFLRLVAAQQEAEFDPEPPALETTDAVRLMSVHKSKGLEFPVVVVADLGKPFNLDELRSALILDEELGLCPQVQPPTRPGKYPSLPYWLARRRQSRELRGEELRLLYVAATRASDKLILVGTTSPSRLTGRWSAAAHPTARDLADATCALDWLGPLLPALTGAADWSERGHGGNGMLAWQVYEADEAPAGVARDPTGTPPREPAIAGEPVACLPCLTWTYPHSAATREPAKTSVSALRRRGAAEDGDEARLWFRPAAWPAGSGGLSATERGTAHHRFLQLVRLDQVGSRAGLAAEAARLRAAGQLSPEEAGALDLAALAAFWRSETGGLVRDHAPLVQRELPFTARLSPADLAALELPVTPGLAADEFVVVQGVADLVVVRPEEIWLLDFKTDTITPATRADKIAAYRPQLALYALALGRIFGRPVTRVWLHFLAANETVPVRLPAPGPWPG
jgi:ATP-dependent helicase/nuclease subunit A